MISMADHSQSSTERQLILSISLTVFWVNKRQWFAHKKTSYSISRKGKLQIHALSRIYSTNIARQKVNGKADRSICTIFWSVHEQGRRRPSRALDRIHGFQGFSFFVKLTWKLLISHYVFLFEKKKTYIWVIFSVDGYIYIDAVCYPY